MTDHDLIRLLRQKSAIKLTSEIVLIVRSQRRESEPFHRTSRDPFDIVASDNQCKARAGTIQPWLLLSIVCLTLILGLCVWYLTPFFAPVVKAVPAKPADVSQSTVSSETNDSGPRAAEVSSEGEASDRMAASSEPQPNGESISVGPTPSPLLATSGPWSEALADDASVWGADSFRWTNDYQRSGHGELSESVAKLWLESVESDSMRLSTELIGKPAFRATRFQGFGKLRAPWRGDAVLRMTPFDVSELTLLFWNGKTGLAFRWFSQSEPPIWAAYQVTRDDASPRPVRWALVTTDNGAYARSTPGTFDIRQQDQRLVLVRGGLVLMSGPFEGVPTEVYLSGQFKLRGLTMHRSDPLPMLNELNRPRHMRADAVDLPWSGVSMESGKIVPHEDGSLSLISEHGTAEVMTSVSFDRLAGLDDAVAFARLCEIQVRVLAAEAGTGFFLGDRNGKPMHRWEFHRKSDEDGLVLRALRVGESERSTDSGPVPEPMAPLAQPVWLKWIQGFGQIQLLISGDGQHWGAISASLSRRSTEEIASFGLFASTRDGASEIKVSSLSGRELSGLTRLVSEHLMAQVGVTSLVDSTDISIWKRQVLDRLPTDVESTEWIVANAIAFLAQRPETGLGRDVMNLLLQTTIHSRLSFSQKFDLLHDASMLCDESDDSNAKGMAALYWELGRQLADAGDSAASVRVRHAILGGPAWTRNPFQSICDQMQSHEILRAVYSHDWRSAWIAARTATFWSALPQADAHSSERGLELSRHARWAESVVAEHAPQFDDGTANIMSPNMRHPMVLTVNKAGYGARTEILAALAAQNFAEACRIVTTVQFEDDLVLLPEPSDSAWFVSFQQFQKMTLDGSSEFAKTMSEQFQELGAVRLRSAINQNDVPAVSELTRQFQGTDTARDANVWLGDRNLARGQFKLAIQCYLDAMEGGQRPGRAAVTPRLILARALAGLLSLSEMGSALEEIEEPSVVLNGLPMSKTEFETLIRERASQIERHDVVDLAINVESEMFPMRSYTLAMRARSEDELGAESGRWEHRLNDSVGRQLAVVSDEHHFYVSTRFQIVCYSKDGAERLWTAGLGGDQADAELWPFMPMKPLVSDNRLFVRRLTKAGAELVCVGLERGDVLWRQRTSLGIVTDPLIWNGRLFAVTAANGDDDLVHVAATWFDVGTGEITDRRELLTLREPLERWYAGQLNINDRLAVCTLAGTTLCFDWKGEVKWLRRHLLLRGPVDELAEDCRICSPIIDDRCVVVALPGVREICCFELQSGRTIWSRPIADTRGILGAMESRIVIDTPRGLVCLARDTGAPAWFAPFPARLELFWLDRTTCAVGHRGEAPGAACAITWIDLETGRRSVPSPILADQPEEFQLGPLFCSANRFFAFAGSSAKKVKRELYELVPVDGDPTIPGHQGPMKPR